MGSQRHLFGVLLLASVASNALAHDYWLQPERFRLSSGESIPIRLFVGDHFKSEAERPFQRKMTVDLRAISKNDARVLGKSAKDDQKPLIKFASRQIGGHLVVLERDWSSIELEASKFNSYLEHEGLGHILAQRRKAGEAEDVGRERYRRYLKTLIQVGDQFDDTYKRRVGHRLEIVPQSDPTRAKQGARIGVQVLFDGKPLTNAAVFTYSRQGDSVKQQQARTNKDGQAQFTLDRSGLWVIRLVHMQRVKADPKVDWESFWTAYSFQR